MLNPDKALSLAVSDLQAQSFVETSSQLLQIPAPIAICSHYRGPTFPTPDLHMESIDMPDVTMKILTHLVKSNKKSNKACPGSDHL